MLETTVFDFSWPGVNVNLLKEDVMNYYFSSRKLFSFIYFSRTLNIKVYSILFFTVTWFLSLIEKCYVVPSLIPKDACLIQGILFLASCNE
jgi:hypothetical protein